MQIISKPMGSYQTNCYIISKAGQQLIIDPGVEALGWIESNDTNPIAILNTHGHFDHVWSNADVQQKYNIPIYIHTNDAFMLQADALDMGMPLSRADVLVDNEEGFKLGDFDIKFKLFAGHTPGCCVVQVDDVWMSGDFLFEGSIGRWDFPFSSANSMLQSLQKVMTIDGDYRVYPGHGNNTTLRNEQRNIPNWISYIQKTMS